MKKLTLTMLLFLGLGFSAMAEGGGLFEMGDTRDGGTRTTGTGLMLPGQHGLTDDQSAPLGTGTMLMLGLGAAYLATKKNNKK